MIKQESIAISSIRSDDRARKNMQGLQDLATDIEENGLIQPIAVMENDGKFKLLAGGRRLAACTILDMETIPCRVYPKMDEYDQALIEEAENLQREDLLYAEKVQLTRKIHNLRLSRYGKRTGSSKIEGHTKKDTADLLGVSESTVGRDIQLADAIDIMPDLAKCGNKNEAMKLLARLKEEAIRDELASRFDTKLTAEGEGAAKRVLINNFIVGDFFKAKVDSGIFNMMEVDPPYGMDLTKTKKTKDTSAGKNYTEIPRKEYPKWINNLCKKCYKLLNNNSWIVLWHSLEWYEVVKEALKLAGFTNIQTAIWYKPNNQAGSIQPTVRLANNYEQFFYARKGDAIIFKPGHTNTFVYSTIPASYKVHLTERPISLTTDILSCFCPPAGTIAVPCCGSGNTMLAANNLGMKAVGWDLAKENKDSYTLKVKSGELRNFKTYKGE